MSKIGYLGFGINKLRKKKIKKYNDSVDKFNNWLKSTNCSVSIQLKYQERVLSKIFV